MAAKKQWRVRRPSSSAAAVPRIQRATSTAMVGMVVVVVMMLPFLFSVVRANNNLNSSDDDNNYYNDNDVVRLRAGVVRAPPTMHLRTFATSNKQQEEEQQQQPIATDQQQQQQYVVALKPRHATSQIQRLLNDVSPASIIVSFNSPRSYIVLLPDKQTAKTLSAHPNISFVAPLAPELRVDPEVSSRSLSSTTTSSSSFRLEISAITTIPNFDDAAASRAMQLTLDNHNQAFCKASTTDDTYLLSVNCTSDDFNRVDDYINKIALLLSTEFPSFIAWIALEPALHVANLKSASIMQSGGQSTTQNAFPIWKRNLRGQNEIVGVGDTGLDVDSCYFRDPYGNAVGRNHSSVLSYRGVADYRDDSGHGTHVAGSLCGSAGTNGRPADSMYDGMAPMTKVVFTDLGISDSVAIVAPPGGMAGHYRYSYDRGARINSDSWGSESPYYTTQSASVDRFAWENLDFLPILASGNDGEYARGIAAPATAKNGLTIGATLGAEGSKPRSEGDAFLLSVDAPDSIKGETIRVLKGTFGKSLVSGTVYTVAFADPVDACVADALSVRAEDARGSRLERVQSPRTPMFGDWERILDMLYGGSRRLQPESLQQQQEKEMEDRPKVVKSAKSSSPLDKETLLVVQRGGCYFSDKVKAAQSAGAGAVLVYNNQDTGFFKMHYASADDVNKDQLDSVTSIAGSKYTGYRLQEWQEKADEVGSSLRLRVVGLARPPKQRFDNIAEFSSFGPTIDGRLKPDLVAPGERIRSASSDIYGICSTSILSGTSMAAPLVAGTAVLVRQYFREGFYPSGKQNAANSRLPSSALIKAVLLNGATNMEGFTADSGLPLERAPSSRQGFGRVMLGNSLVFDDDKRNMFVYDYLTERDAHVVDDEEHFFCVHVPEEAGSVDPISITLAWTDYPASSSASEEEPLLVNDLDLDVTVPSGERPADIGGLSEWPDRKNNVERLKIATPSPGKNYVVKVKGHAVRLFRSYSRAIGQPYALVIVGPSIQVRRLADGTTSCGDEEVDDDKKKKAAVARTSTKSMGASNAVAQNGRRRGDNDGDLFAWPSPCECSSSGYSAGGSRVPVRGCAMHSDDVQRKYCYTRGPCTACIATATNGNNNKRDCGTSSLLYSGAYWRYCTTDD